MAAEEPVWFTYIQILWRSITASQMKRPGTLATWSGDTTPEITPKSLPAIALEATFAINDFKVKRTIEYVFLKARRRRKYRKHWISRRKKHKKKSGGGTACCVPTCKNSTKRNSNLSFHKFPKAKKLRSEWVHLIGRKDFVPNEHHRVCSEHFPGGKKSYINNVPTVTPKKLQLTKSKPRATFKCRNRIPITQLAGTNCTSTNSQVEVDSNSENKPTVEDLEHQIARLENELRSIKEEHEREVSDLKVQLKQAKLSLDRFKESGSDIEFYTGFSNYSNFKAFFKFLSSACLKSHYIGSKNGDLQPEQQEKRGRKRSLSPEEELFLVLSRLRCGLLERDLANRYDISVSQVSSIWITWIDFLHKRLRSIPIWPSRSLVDSKMAPGLKEHHPKTRVIIDCTEIFIEKPSSPSTQSATFSTYKHPNTAKGRIGISPAGTLSFASELYAGRTSDIELTNDCGILTLLDTEDEIMADKGFNIEEDLPERISLNIPPFLHGEQLSHEEEVRTRRIAKERIHVERLIEKASEKNNNNNE
ncbi:uncharacterized protein LOC110250208 [Exaiptasia diaphana]|uniref:THAP-type domain-containing protein n=1 Tax=Exaiptasia diaphana TaxID=2652724 RepID=A0A913Y085_EXADI|nr:uncharacterized protein LOC110250208 [Exaiptasia diaphana]KXJ07684.1 THAP domain-containing protein 11 [Exaiptasia diaphana]